MPYTFDLFGWYTGPTVSTARGRATEIAPQNESISTTPGEMRANWTGNAWLDMPYAEPPAAPVVGAPVPEQVTMRQAQLALLAAGHHAGVLPAIQALQEPLRSQSLIEWATASTVRRGNPLVDIVGTAVGLDAQAIDALFIAAERIPS